MPEVNGKPLKPFSKTHQYKARFTNNGMKQEIVSCDSRQDFWYSFLNKAVLMDTPDSRNETTNTQADHSNRSNSAFMNGSGVSSNSSVESNQQKKPKKKRFFFF